MNDELKEKKTKRIIEKIEGLATYVTIPRELAIYNVNIDSQEAKLLIDYITNLQQENEKLKEENEKLKELDENYPIEEELAEAYRREEDYKSRIEKAVEYIKKDTRWFDSEYAKVYGELCSCAGANADRLEVLVNPGNLLNILNGRSDE